MGVLEHWGKDLVMMKVRLPDSIPVRVLVNAKNEKAAEARLRGCFTARYRGFSKNEPRGNLEKSDLIS